MDDSVTVVVPTRDEADRIGGIVATLVATYDVLVVDDGSDDATAAAAEAAGASVVSHDVPQGRAEALRTGFDQATGDIIALFEPSGAYDPGEVDDVVAPIVAGEADIVFGTRPALDRLSEWTLNKLVTRTTGVPDPSTDVWAIRALALPHISVGPACDCGVVALAATAADLRIEAVGISFQELTGPRDLAWYHFRQLGAVFRHLIVGR
ncbi:glycosyltransferase [Halorhabdus sp. CUG00001]|uniref:glycosyltransferase n=1 Tax=Halorhabdus sp. CUG00001 TaxID=2600297 RepID=UPI00131B65C3|nr:glycosyltransferase [Halorhabdus sp. CUG00001]